MANFKIATVTIDSISPDSGSSSSDFNTSTHTLSVSGTLTTGTGNGTKAVSVWATLGGTHVYLGQVAIAAAGSQSWSIPVSTNTLVDGAYTLQAYADTSTSVWPGASPLGSHALTIDTTAPTAAATITALSADTGSLNNDFVTLTAAQSVSGTFTGSLGSGESIQVSANGGTTWVTATTSGATWSAAGVNLSAGANTLSVRTIDTAGNALAGTGHSYNLDTVAPSAPGVALTSDTGSSGTDHISSVGTLTLSGVETGAVVQYSTDGGSTWGGSFTAAEGANSVKVRQTDVAGNVSAASATFSFVLDTNAPATPGVALTSDTGSSGTDKITKVGTLALTGVETNAVVEYSTDGGTTWGSTFTAAEGANSVKVRQTDVAGNVSTASSAFAFTYDSTAPANPGVALTNDTGSSELTRSQRSARLR